MLVDSLFKSLYRPLCLYAAHYLKGDLDTAEDIVQDCFVKFWQLRSKEGNHNSQPSILNSQHFLYTSVHNACIDYLRRQHPEILSFEPYDLDGIISDDEAQMRSFEEAKLWTAIDSLPARQREIFLMSKRDGMTYAEIAHELNLSVKTIEHQISKALHKLRSDSNLSSLYSLLIIAF